MVTVSAIVGTYHQIVFKMNAAPWTALTNISYVNINATGTFEYALTETDVTNIQNNGMLIGVKGCTVTTVKFRHANTTATKQPTVADDMIDASYDGDQASKDYSDLSTRFAALEKDDVVRFNLTPNASSYHQIFAYVLTGEKWDQSVAVLNWADASGSYYDVAISTDEMLSYFKGTYTDQRALRVGVKNSTITSIQIIKTLAITDIANPACEAGTFKKVSLTRSLVAGYNTLCLPFGATKAALGLEEDDAIYELGEGSTASSIKLNTVTSIVANKPYIVYCAATRTLTSSFENLEVSASDASSTTQGDWTMYGNYTPSLSMNGKYIVYGNEIRLCGDGPYVNGLRAYFEYKGAEAREFVTFDFNDGTTAVDDVRSVISDAKSEYFNLAGQRIAQPTKGLYIVNGKKVLIK